MSFINYFNPEDADFRSKCDEKIHLLDNELVTLHIKYDARNEITNALRDLSRYITKINNTQSLMSSVWVRTSQLLLVHQEMSDIIAKTTEVLKPFITYHNPACKEVLKTLGLTLNEDEPVEAQIATSISNHLKNHLFKLIKSDVHAFVEKTIAAIKGSENLVELRTQLLSTLNDKFCTPENIKWFDNKKEGIEAYILQTVEECVPKLIDAKTAKFIDNLTQKVKALNIQLHLEPPKSLQLFFCSTYKQSCV